MDKQDDQKDQNQPQQQQPIQPQAMPVAPDMNDPNIAASMIQQQMFWGQNMGMGMPQQPYDPTQFGATPFYGYPYMMQGFPQMMMPQQPYQPQIQQFTPIGGSQYVNQGGPRPFPKGPYGQQNNYRGGYNGGNNQYNNNGSNHGSVGTGSKFNTQKFKTQLCRHFMQQGTCSQADSCLFAHGEHEMRKITDPVPADADAKAAIVQQNNQGLQQNHHVGQNRGGSGHHHHHQNNNTRGGYQQSNNYQSSRGGSSHQGGRGGHYQGGYIQKSNSYQPSNSNSGNQNFKTAKCKNFDMGSCKYGAQCTFAHGDQDLRKTQSQGPPQAPQPLSQSTSQSSYLAMSHSTPAQNNGQPIMAAGLSAAAFPVLGGQPNAQ